MANTSNHFISVQVLPFGARCAHLDSGARATDVRTGRSSRTSYGRCLQRVQKRANVVLLLAWSQPHLLWLLLLLRRLLIVTIPLRLRLPLLLRLRRLLLFGGWLPSSVRVVCRRRAYHTKGHRERNAAVEKSWFAILTSGARKVRCRGEKHLWGDSVRKHRMAELPYAWWRQSSR